MKKLFTVFVIAVAVIFMANLEAFAGEKSFELVGQITAIEYLKADAETDCITELCLLVNVEDDADWPVQISVENGDEAICGNDDMILKHMASTDWALDSLDVILEVTVRPEFSSKITGFQLNDADSCTACPWCEYPE